MGRFRDWNRAHPVQSRVYSGILFGVIFGALLCIDHPVATAVAEGLVGAVVWTIFMYLVVDLPLKRRRARPSP